jgi:hypothetical protein
MKNLVFGFTLAALSLGMSSVVMAGLPHPIGGTDNQARCITELNRCIASALNCPSCTDRDKDINVGACIDIYNNCIGL